MLVRTLIASVLAASLATSAQAGILLYGYYLPDFNFDKTTPGPILVPLSGTTPANGLTSLGFKVPKSGRVKITFTAECLIESKEQTSLAWVDIDIVIDGFILSAISPTRGSSDAFCGDQAVSAIEPPVARLTHPSITVAPKLAAGTHVITIIARLSTNRSQPPSLNASGGISQSTILIEQ